MKPTQYNSIDPRFPYKNRDYFSVCQAYSLGYYSKSEWLRRGKEIVEIDKPTLAVAKAWETNCPRDNDIILVYNHFQYLVTNERFDAEIGKKCSWPVYPLEQTLPKRRKSFSNTKSESLQKKKNEGFVILEENFSKENSSNNYSSNSFLSSFSILSYLLPIDRRHPSQIDATPNTTNDLLIINRQQKSREALNKELKNDKQQPVEGFVILDDLDTTSKPQSTDDKPRLRPAKGRRVEFRGLIPTEFTEADWDKIKGFEEEFAVFCWRLIWFRTIKQQHADDWVDMAYDWCEVNIPKWRDLKKLLIGKRIVKHTEIVKMDIGGILHVFPRGKELGKAFGYRLTNPAYRKNYSTVEITKPSVIKYLSTSKLKSPVLRWLEHNLRRLQIIDWDAEHLLQLAEESWGKERDGSVEGRQERYKATLQWIREDNWIFEPDNFSGRLHTNLTTLKKETRKYLRVGGKHLAQCDLPNSQPMFLAAACRNTKYYDAKFFDLCCKGEFYEHLADLGGWSRQDVKDQFTRKALFAPNDSSYQELPVKLRFDVEFPRIADYMRKQKYGKPTKEKPKPHNRLARRLQREEIKLIMAACNRIRRERPEMFLATIHDSLCFEVENGDYVKRIMEEELGRIGLTTKLKIESFC